MLPILGHRAKAVSTATSPQCREGALCQTQHTETLLEQVCISEAAAACCLCYVCKIAVEGRPEHIRLVQSTTLAAYPCTSRYCCMTGSSLKRLPCTLERPPLFFCASTVTCSAKCAPQ